MTDVVSKETRSRMMAGIKSKNTKPEIMIRKFLFSKGFRYRIHDKRLPGKPDIYLPKYNCVIFTHGCFWHGHDCKYFKWPKTNTEFWHNKITNTIAHDKMIRAKLNSMDYNVFVIWECDIRHNWPAVCERLLNILDNLSQQKY